MKVSLDQIKASATPLAYHEDASGIDARLHEGAHGGSDDFRFPQGLDVDLEHYRAGLDVVFDGRLRGPAEGTCARCLEPYPFGFDEPFRVLLAPRSTGDGDEGDDDRGLGFFEGDEIDVTALVVEHAMLALPTVPLCAETCRGLCPQCGTNRNSRPCSCETDQSPNPRGFAALAASKLLDQRGGR
jgi:uncharacterized protein